MTPTGVCAGQKESPKAPNSWTMLIHLLCQLTGVRQKKRRRVSPTCSHHRPYDNPRGARELSAMERVMPAPPSGTVTFLFTDIEGSATLGT